MAKKIYPGNWVTNLSSYQGQPVVAVPGRVYHHVVGYALVTSTGATEFAITIPSPDMRKDLGVGTAASGLVGTNTDTIAVKDAAASAAGSITTSVVSSPTIAVASTTIAPASAKKGIVTAAVLSGAETLKVYVRNAAGNAAGSALSSTQTGGTPIIVEVSYFIDDEVAGLDDTYIPFITET